MIRKGIRFRESKTLVVFTPTEDQLTQLQAEKFVPEGTISPGYVFVAKVVPETAKNPPKNSLETRLLGYQFSGAPVLVTPVRITGWSRTNQLYARFGGKDHTIWVEDGRVYLG
jgi:hypothetical protein